MVSQSCNESTIGDRELHEGMLLLPVSRLRFSDKVLSMASSYAFVVTTIVGRT